MAEHAPVPEDLMLDGKPYWQRLGGAAVTLMSDSANLFYEINNGFKQRMREQNHEITNIIEEGIDIENRVSKFYEGELGVVVVHGTLKEFKHWGNDQAPYVPAILKKMGEVVPTIYSPLAPHSRSWRELLFERGYTAVVDYSNNPVEIIVDTAQMVSHVARQAQLV